MVYWPDSPVRNWRRHPDYAFDSVTCAPGAGALFGSIIVPESWAFTACVWLHAGTLIRKAQREATKVLIPNSCTHRKWRLNTAIWPALCTLAVSVYAEKAFASRAAVHGTDEFTHTGIKMRWAFAIAMLALSVSFSDAFADNLAEQIRAAQSAGDYQKAAKLYQQLIADGTDSPEVRSNLGMMLHLA